MVRADRVERKLSSELRGSVLVLTTPIGRQGKRGNEHVWGLSPLLYACDEIARGDLRANHERLVLLLLVKRGGVVGDPAALKGSRSQGRE
jgi:hypothetical protein